MTPSAANPSSNPPRRAAGPSESPYRSLFENMFEGLAHCRMLFENGQPQDFIYLEVNRAFEKLTGLKNVVGKHVTEVIPGIRKSQPELFAAYGRVASTGRPEKFEVYLQALKAWFAISVYSTEPGCFTAVFENITERKEAAEALRESERRYRLLFNSVSDAVFVHEGLGAADSPVRFIEVNDAACQRLGYTREELLQMGPAEIDAPEVRHAAPQVQKQLAAEKAAVWEGVHVTKDGLAIPVEISSRLFHLNGRATYLSTARDITERRAAELRLQSSRQRLFEIIEETPAGYFFIGKDRRYRHVNGAWLKMHGFSDSTEVVGADFSLTQTQEGRKAAEDAMTRVLAGEHIYSGEFSRRCRDGSTAYHSLTASRVITEGKVIGLEGFLIDITPLKNAEAAILRSQQELEAIYDSTPIMMCFVNRDRQVERMNHSMADFVGVSSGDRKGPGDLLGCVNALDDPRGCGFGAGCHACPLRLAVVNTFETGEPARQVEAGLVLARGGVRREIQVSASIARVRLQDQPKVMVCLEDITSRKRLEAQFLQAQKMEAIGQLAGGVAHDFNNILAATLLHLELLQRKHGLDSDMRASLRDLQRNTQRAASLTRQLLLFSRRQVMQTRKVDLNAVIQGLMKMLKRLLGEHIETLFNPSPEPAWVEGDSGMLEQVAMNLCVNARDAMPKGGPLILAIEILNLSAQDARRHPDAQAGRFACIVVIDTGCGMDEATLKRIFEPFFTTKQVGKGTGLGLATVFGIVRQHHGWVEVESEPGRGTKFRVFLPAVEPPELAARETAKATVRGGTETILLVEDDATVRQMVKTMLRLFGYEVLEAGNGVEALQMWEQHGSRVSLVLTDMVMPEGITGLDLAEQLRQLKPGLKVVVSSGYSVDLLQREGRPPTGIIFLAKPYDPDALARTVRECLDREGQNEYTHTVG